MLLVVSPFGLCLFLNYHLATPLLQMIVNSILNKNRDLRATFKSQTYDDTKRSQTELTTENKPPPFFLRLKNSERYSETNFSLAWLILLESVTIF